MGPPEEGHEKAVGADDARAVRGPAAVGSVGHFECGDTVQVPTQVVGRRAARRNFDQGRFQTVHPRAKLQN